MNDKDLLEYIAAQVGKLSNDMTEVRNSQVKMEAKLEEVEKKLEKVDRTVIKIENEHGKKLEALFDGYIQNSDKLERIEKEVSRQEEIVMRRVK